VTDTVFVTYPVSVDAATAFLASDPVGNVELLTALRYDADIRRIGVPRLDNQMAFEVLNPVREKHGGGRLSSLLPQRRREQAGKPATTRELLLATEGGAALIGVLVIGREGMDDRLTARFATEDAGALDALIAAMPRGVSRIAVQRAWMLPAFHAAFRLAPEDDPEILFSLTEMPTLPVGDTRLLTLLDAPMMAASATLWGRTGLVDAVHAGFRPFGIVRGDRVVACAMAANVTEWTEEVMSVWTAPRHRGQGLATAVVARTAADIVARGKSAIYVAAEINRASQRVAEKVGFQRAYDITAYRIRR
jgi:RimJ/RimL family protein N-acetyltransferase